LIERRAILASGITGLLAVVASDGQAFDSAAPLEIIDCHTHFYDPSRPEGVPWPGKGTSLYRTVLPEHLRALKQFRSVTGTVIVEASPLVEDNAWLLDLAKDDPFVVGIVGNLVPGKAEFSSHLKRFAANPLFRGIRISATLLEELLAQDSLKDLQALADFDLALDVNGGPNTPSVIAKLASRLPHLRIVLNHIGNVRITAEKPPQPWLQGIQAAAQHANVYCKISALVEGAAFEERVAPKDLAFYQPYIDVVWQAFGDHRVIYGSNWPVSERAADYETLQRIAMEYALQKGNEATAKFCSQNAMLAYKWVDRPGRL